MPKQEKLEKYELYPIIRRVRDCMVFLVLIALMTCCTNSVTYSDEGREKGHISQPLDTFYTEKAAMDAYAAQPERALQIIDSAVIVGNLTPLRADLVRAVVYARTNEDINYDSAILIGERLMHHDSVMANSDLQEAVLDVLLNA